METGRGEGRVKGGDKTAGRKPNNGYGANEDVFQGKKEVRPTCTAPAVVQLWTSTIYFLVSMRLGNPNLFCPKKSEPLDFFRCPQPDGSPFSVTTAKLKTPVYLYFY